MDEKARVTVSPGFERLQDDLLRSVLVLAQAQAAKFLRLSLTVHYQLAPPLQEPDGEETDIRALEENLRRSAPITKPLNILLKGTITKNLLMT